MVRLRLACHSIYYFISYILYVIMDKDYNSHLLTFIKNSTINISGCIIELYPLNLGNNV